MAVALHPPRCFPRRLYGGQEQSHQHADDGDYDEQLHQRKAAANRRRTSHRRISLTEKGSITTPRPAERRPHSPMGGDCTLSKCGCKVFFEKAPLVAWASAFRRSL